ncbi:MAG: alpha-2-macroglobulin family protein, partial [Pseudorhodoplanes sp.]|nr:alpha-2-macroglobulin family protein [Pseudorhodoplanes sp.]
MFALTRAGLFAALVAFACLGVVAAPAGAQTPQKAFEREDLADAAIRLEAQIKADAGLVQKPAPQLRREAEAAFQKNDFRGGLQMLGQAIASAPEDAGTWLRLARAVMLIRPNDDRERTLLYERAATAAYIAYRRTADRNEEADALVILGKSFSERKVWRPALNALRLALELREAPDLRVQYERLRDDHGFRLVDYKVDSDSSSPRVCFQFSENLPGKRTDFSPFVNVAGQDKPAVSADGRQVCVEGLRHGERYAISLRAGLPSTVKETLAKTANFNIYVRDRKPLVRFTNKAYVLPRNGQQGIPVVSVNTPAVAIEVYRVGDRNLVNTVLGSDFQRTLYRYDIERLGTEYGVKVWGGELTVEPTLNADVTTAFPVDQALGELAPGVYAMLARPKSKTSSDDDEGALATQWFIVSDLGMSAYSGNDGIHAFVHSLATADPKSALEVRLLSRSNEVLATKKTDSNGRVSFEANLTRGEAGAVPALLVASDTRNDYAFLSLKSPAFDLTDRGVAGRRVPAGLDAFVYTERGVYRSGESVHITALLRDAQGVAATGVPLTLIVMRPDGVEYRRSVLPDQGVGGRSLSLPITATAPTGTWRVRAYTDPKQPALGEASFMVEDYVPDRLEFDLASEAKSIARATPVEITLDGRFLYGAPAAGLGLEGEVVVAAAKERAIEKAAIERDL